MPKKQNKSKLLLLTFISFLLGFQSALIAYITSSFLQESSGLKNVGIFYFLAYGGAFLVMLNVHHLVKKYGKSKVFVLFLIFKLLVLTAIGLWGEGPVAVILVVWALMSGQLMWLALDIMIESFSQDSITGTIRGRILTIENTGWLVAPFLAAWIVDDFGYKWVYAVGTIMIISALLIVLKHFNQVNHNIKKDLDIKAVLMKIWRKRDVARIYYVSLMLETFYAAMVIYMPLHLQQLGFSWPEIGKIFTVMLVPFLLLQYPLGVIADKKTGEKEWLFLAFLIIVIFTMGVSFVQQGTMVTWMVILFMTRVGAAMVEVMRDSYFYKQVGPEDVDLIDFYRTARSVANIMATAFFSLVLMMVSLKWSFVVLAFVVISAIWPIAKLKDTR